MLGFLLGLGIWLIISLLIVFALVLTFVVGSYIAERLELNNLSYYICMLIVYIIIFTLLMLLL